MTMIRLPDLERLMTLTFKKGKLDSFNLNRKTFLLLFQPVDEDFPFLCFPIFEETDHGMIVTLVLSKYNLISATITLVVKRVLDNFIFELARCHIS